jgi:hypothetical protein
MVYRGRPSAACGECRDRRIKVTVFYFSRFQRLLMIVT